MSTTQLPTGAQHPLLSMVRCQQPNSRPVLNIHCSARLDANDLIPGRCSTSTAQHGLMPMTQLLSGAQHSLLSMA
ncbi:hypothetical protein U1Q18_028560 [Sarracenia purpurea var. burkii]